MPEILNLQFILVPINFEFKARHQDIAYLERKLQNLTPKFIGEDHQVDTYFLVPHGRLKLREGSIEKALIHYERADDAAAKQSTVLLYTPNPDGNLKEVLTKALGIKAIVDKRRKIYFIDNVKFHFDEVKELGSFVEVEAIDKTGTLGLLKLQEQCGFYQNLFHLIQKDFIAQSYSDLILAKKSSTSLS